MRTMRSLSYGVALAIAGLAFPAFAAPAPAPSDGAAGQRANKISAADTNKDGFIDKGEWQAQRDRIFDRLDSNHDGKLSREEMSTGRDQTARPQRPAASGQSRDDARPRQDRFTRLDTDKDGFVRREEFAAASDRLFARCDKNGDGRVAPGECRGGNQRAAARQPRRTDPANP